MTTYEHVGVISYEFIVEEARYVHVRYLILNTNLNTN